MMAMNRVALPTRRVLSNGFLSRFSSFSFAGPRKLNDILKQDMIADKTGAEVSELWHLYHESKENSVGLVRNAKDGKILLQRASKCPFFIHPVFRDGGYFTLVSQFQSPYHFLLAYLEDYKVDPTSASPLLTLSVFDDLQKRDIVLIRADIVTKSIGDEEGKLIVENLVHCYLQEFESIENFNLTPEMFDFESYLARMKSRENGSNVPGNAD